MEISEIQVSEIQLNEEYIVPENIRETLRNLIEEIRAAQTGLNFAMRTAYRAEQAAFKIVRSAMPELNGYSFRMVMDDDTIKVQPVEFSNL